jgi:hypothetical protein
MEMLRTEGGIMIARHAPPVPTIDTQHTRNSVG